MRTKKAHPPHFSTTCQVRHGKLTLNLKPSKKPVWQLETPSGFINYLLELMAQTWQVHLTVKATFEVDQGLQPFLAVLGEALGEGVSKIFNGKIKKETTFSYWLEEDALARCILRKGSPHLLWEIIPQAPLFIRKDLPFQLLEEFFQGFSRGGSFNMVLTLLQGKNAEKAAIAMVQAFSRGLIQLVC